MARTMSVAPVRKKPNAAMIRQIAANFLWNFLCVNETTNSFPALKQGSLFSP